MSDYSNKKEVINITCKVDKVLYRDEKSGRIILSVTDEDGTHFRVLGKAKKVDVNCNIQVSGEWREDEKYGKQFQADSIQITADSSADESEYLECTVLSVKVLKEETGFAMAMALDDDGKKIKLSGSLSDVYKDAKIGVTGKWKHDEKYGDEFKVDKWEHVLSYDEDDDVEFSLTKDELQKINNAKILMEYSLEGELYLEDEGYDIDDGVIYDCDGNCLGLVSDYEDLDRENTYVVNGQTVKDDWEEIYHIGLTEESEFNSMEEVYQLLCESILHYCDSEELEETDGGVDFTITIKGKKVFETNIFP